MSLYEPIAALPLHIEGYSLERLARTVSSGFERVSTVIALEGGGATGLGEDVTYQAEAHEAQIAAGPILDLAGADHVPRVLPAARATRPVPGLHARAGGVSRLPALGLRVGGAGPRAAPGQHVAARAARPHRGAGHVRRLVADGRSADARARDPAAGALPEHPLQARRDPGLDRRADRGPAGDRRGRLDRLQGRLQGHARRHAAPTPPSTARSPRRSRTRGSRIPTSRPTRRATRSRPTRTGSPGTRRSTTWPTSWPPR